MPKNPHEKAIQRALMQYKNPENRELILEGLKMTGRMDLVGFGPKCLIRPRELHGKNTSGRNADRNQSGRKAAERNSSSSAKKTSKTRVRSSSHEKYKKNKNKKR